MVSSRELADVIADAMGVPRETMQLHLRTIRAAGQIAFSGYGRAAARMTSDEASRLVIAAAGSRFAKDSLDVLRRFGAIKAVRSSETKATLEQFLSGVIRDILMAPSSQQPFNYGSPHLADIALQLLEPIGPGGEGLPCHAMVRWINKTGDSKLMLFGPPQNDRRPRNRGGRQEPLVIQDLITRYEGHQFFQVRIVRRQALVDVAMAL